MDIIKVAFYGGPRDGEIVDVIGHPNVGTVVIDTGRSYKYRRAKRERSHLGWYWRYEYEGEVSR